MSRRYLVVVTAKTGVWLITSRFAGIEVPQELWASPTRSPPLPPKKAPWLFLFVLFFPFVDFLFLSLVFVFFSAFVSHGTSPLFKIDRLSVKHVD